jgi:hypothetical protein
VATTSIQKAVKDKFDGLDASNFPSATAPGFYFGSAPQTDAAGTQLRPPYVVYTESDRGVKPLDFERNNLVTVTFTFELVANTLADVDATANAIRWNGGGVGDGWGFDYGTVAGLSAPRSSHQILPVGEPRRAEPTTDRNGARVHVALLTYRVTVLESA